MKSYFSAALTRLFLLTLLASAGLFTTACKKDDPEIADYSAVDQETITNYLAANNITTSQKQPSGLQFIPVRTNANAPKVTAGTSVAVLYTGHLLDAAGTVFDASAKHTNPLLTFVPGANQIIAGFDEGVSLMHVGDKAEFLLPSALGYGTKAVGSIPANSVLRFEVEVVDVPTYDDNLITTYLGTKSITTAQKQASGLYFLPVTTNASAVRPAIGNTVTVLYTGHLFDATGTVFDASSLHNNAPISFTFGRGQLITGFEEGIALMHKGDKAELMLPSALAYGVQGSSGGITPNSALRFEVEVVDIK
ncbi:FKBP-type peptidyl-prolyl cis-trans isomerase [Hymenobacter negativus]|uniref:Peptidyl-prolyl cis-trans isomerase n=1 Tax=Hymenobacter negativus TaxID=2795026 RepID=A0ABS0Q2Z5_9BACT|nr:FKBP-type peptidyl-prolyl cis-trans isomerase [Hymenobacter negativus]MBH8557031.1 FKBP-type peptidyl-prolyl cis-trans isomerase [Hymenobacter negativus]